MILARRGFHHTSHIRTVTIFALLTVVSKTLNYTWSKRAQKDSSRRHPQLPAQVCLDSGVKDKRGSHKPQPRPTAQRKGLHGLPHPSFPHKALELTPSGLSAAETMGTPVTQYHSSCPAHVCPSQFLLLSSQCIRSPRKLSCQPRSY